MTRFASFFSLGLCLLCCTGQAAPAQPSNQDASAREKLMLVLDFFVRGWREGDIELLRKAVAMEEGHITCVSGEGNHETLRTMTFAEALHRNRTHPEYGREGWKIEALEIVDDELAFARLSIPEATSVNVDFLTCYRVRGQWRIVSNTFVIQERRKP